LEFDWEGDGTVDHIGIVESYDPETGVVTTLEGNSSDSVARREYDVNDGRIAGYISSNVDKANESAAATEAAEAAPAGNGVDIDGMIGDAASMLGMDEYSNAAELNAYIDEHGSGLNVDQYHWCAAFATAVENKYGNMDFSELENWDYTPTIQQWAKDQGTWHDAGGDYVPNPGEMLEFDWEADGEVDHIGIVESYDPETGIVTTLEGNSADSVARREYDVNDWRIAGYISSNVD
ncbi:MAG: CHAP domain-containing protein, partial [bacterium]|nr:CHAP domain-containing protein [bacterium]